MKKDNNRSFNGNDDKITVETVKNNHEFKTLIKCANDNLDVMGYTEHGLRHVGYVSNTTANILRELNFPKRMVEIGAIAGWIHDIGNAINRKNHGHTGAGLAFNVLTRMGMDIEEIAEIIGAIGNREEETGLPVNAVCAALIIADKSDAHRSRVRRRNRLGADGKTETDDIHDRVNMSIKKNYIYVDKVKKRIRLVIFMDDKSATMEFLQIYLSRVVLCEKAASFLNCSFELVINNVVINRQKPQKNTVKKSPDETEVSED